VLAAIMARRPVFASLLCYLAATGWDVPAAVLAGDPRVPMAPNEDIQALLAQVYERQGEAAEVCETLVDIDEGVQEWRYRHVKMVERIIGTKRGTGGSAGSTYLRATLFRPAFPDLWEVRSRS
jgi:tryptophan 2,3-dioxygenase